MKRHRNAQLDTLMTREVFGRIVFMASTALLIVSYAWVMFSKEIKAPARVFGVTQSHQIVLHDEGHTRYLWVLIEGEDNRRRVRLPGAVPIKLGVKVELTKSESRLKQSTYAFIRYLNI